MRNWFLRRRWVGMLVCGSVLSGCISTSQLQDFALTEIVRVIADLTGQLVAILLQAQSPLAAA